MASSTVCAAPAPSLSIPSVLLPPRPRLASSFRSQSTSDFRRSTPSAPLPSFRLPANPFPSSPAKSAPTTPRATSRSAFLQAPQFVEFVPFVPTAAPLPVRRQVACPPAYLNMSSTSSIVESDIEFEQFDRDGSHISDATFDGYQQYDDCPASTGAPYSATTGTHEPGETYAAGSRFVAGMSQETRTKRSWNDARLDSEASYGYASPDARQKRFRVEPITPITPSSSATHCLSSSRQGGYHSASSQHLPIARTLSYGTDETLPLSASYVEYAENLRPPSSRSSFSQHDSYDQYDHHGGQQFGYSQASPPDSCASSTLDTPFLTCTTAQSSYFEDVPVEHYPDAPGLLASPILIPHSAPIERGHFQPYPDVESTSMALSYSLPQPPPQYSTPRSSRTIHSRREEDYHYPSGLSTPQRDYSSSRFQLHSPVSPQSDYPPALVPIPSSSTPPSAARSSPSGSCYTPNQAALVSAASMNRLLSRFPPTTPTKTTSSPASKGPAVSAIHPRYREPPPPRVLSVSPVKVEKMHTCIEHGCGKRFKRLEHLKRHERTHTLEKPYGCDVPGCGRYFSRSDNLAQHRKTHDRNGKTSRAMAAAAAARAAAEAAAIAATGPY